MKLYPPNMQADMLLNLMTQVIHIIGDFNTNLLNCKKHLKLEFFWEHTFIIHTCTDE